MILYFYFIEPCCILQAFVDFIVLFCYCFCDVLEDNIFICTFQILSRTDYDRRL